MLRLLQGLIAIVTAWGIITSPASAQGTAEGTVSYDSDSVKMTAAYARETRPSPTSDQPPQVVVLVTDRPAPAEIVASRQAYYAAARAGQIRGFLIVFETPSDKPRLAIFAPGGASDDTSVPDLFSQTSLTELVREGNFVSGRLQTNGPREFNLDADSPHEPATYAIDVRFRVPISPAPQPSEVLSGEAARNSPQTAAALRTLQLIKAGNVAEVREQLHPDHPVWRELQTDQSGASLEMAREMLPDPATFVRSVQRVLVYRDDAIIVARDSEGNTAVLLRRDNGKCKLAPPSIPND